MSYSNSTQIAVDVGVCLEQLSQFIESRSKRLSKNSKGIFFTGDDMEELRAIYERFSKLSPMIAKNEELLTQQSLQTTYMRGKIEHMNQVLQLCYNDYKNSNRHDAVTFLTIEMSR